MTTFLWYLY